MKKIAFLVLMSFAAVSSAQSREESVVGNHAGYLVWEKTYCTLELKDNSVYVMTTYDPLQLQPEASVKGQWTLDGNKIILTNLVGEKTILHKDGNRWYIVGQNGLSNVATFTPNKTLKEFREELSKKGGC